MEKALVEVLEVGGGGLGSMFLLYIAVRVAASAWFRAQSEHFKSFRKGEK